MLQAGIIRSLALKDFAGGFAPFCIKIYIRDIRRYKNGN